MVQRGKRYNIYIRGENLKRWRAVSRKSRPAFLDWALRNYPPLLPKEERKQ